MDAEKGESCPFCRIARHEQAAEVIQEDGDVMALMDLFPATAGHVLVIPKRHIQSIYELPPALAAHLMVIAVGVARAIKTRLSPDGLNLIQANEPAGGQTISHFHLHIVPRYEGDLVTLSFGHGNAPAPAGDLKSMASLIRSALDA